MAARVGSRLQVDRVRAPRCARLRVRCGKVWPWPSTTRFLWPMPLDLLAAPPVAQSHRRRRAAAKCGKGGGSRGTALMADRCVSH
eukprot:363280-Chlamydomonas_euryale.AAC.11